MKRAQLMQLEIPGSILLVDESQDMNGCQIDWVAKQAQRRRSNNTSKQIYVVGDAAQTIFGFRGAKSEYLMELSIDHERMLTQSWRFGPGIANIANLVLFAKERSPQTSKVYDRRKGCEKWKNWSPYRVRPGNAQLESLVTSASLLEDWAEYKERNESITFLARNNKTLFSAALTILGFGPGEQPKNGSTSPQQRTEKEEDDEEYDYIDDEDRKESATPSTDADPDDGSTDSSPFRMPRIHINGNGENSGRKAWLTFFKSIGAVYDLYKLHRENPTATTKLAPTKFPEFAGRDMSWSSFVADVQEREMTKYSIPIGVVNSYKDQTPAAVAYFEQEVIEKNYPANDADIIMTTCHSAKGMEWDHVQVADDFLCLADYKPCNNENGNRLPAFKRFKTDESSNVNKREWNFGFCSWGDDVNLVYVACTRSKRTLSLPPCIIKAIADFDVLSDFVANEDDEEEPPFLHGLEQVNETSLKEIHDSLVTAFRNELKILDGETLTDFLLAEEDSNGPLLCSPTDVSQI